MKINNELDRFIIALAQITPPTPLTQEEDERLTFLHHVAEQVGIDNAQFPLEEYIALIFKRDPQGAANLTLKSHIERYHAEKQKG